MESSRSQQMRDGGRPHVGDQDRTQNSRQQFQKLPGQVRSKLAASERQRDAENLRWNQDRAYRPAQTDFRTRQQAFHAPRHSDSVPDLPQSPPGNHSAGRHLSHISALTSAQPSEYSRPVSVMSCDNGIGFSDSKKFSESPSATPRSKGRSRASTNGSQSKLRLPGQSDPMPSNDASATMEALTSAIRQGLGPSKVSSRSTTPKPFSEAVRMPFQDDQPESPTSVYTEGTAAYRDTLPLSAYHGYNPRESKPATIDENEVEDFEKLHFADSVPTPRSEVSNSPMLQNEVLGMSNKMSSLKRPPRLDIAAVREAEARGSLTSLSDLIRRATRLASNLDRGKTASRLGHLDMFGSSEKLDGSRLRNSTYSDVLAAFPPPADGTTTPARDRPATMWPGSGKQFMMSKSSLGAHGDGSESGKEKRQCCGLSLFAFVLMLTVLVLLVAAAVLIPVFLIVLPKQHQKTLGECSSSHTCRNNGIAVITSESCSCVCVDGFTGNDCSHESDPECTTASLYDGTNLYENATIGTALLPILQPQAQIHGVPLNTTVVLATFAANNLSCASENSLVVFNQNSNSQAKRLLMLDAGIASSKLSGSVVVADKQRRQDATQSANGIVFATSSQQSQPTATSIPAAATPTATGSNQKVASNDTLNFAAAVVLYVLQTNSEINAAVLAKQAMTAYFTEKNSANHTVVVAAAPQRIAVNFDTFQINLANGTNLGG